MLGGTLTDVLKVMDLIISNDLGENIVFLGRTDERTISKVLGEADVLAGPSYFEGYGISYVEALGYGVPVIATTSGGAKEIISDGVEGFLVPPGDHKALTDRLNRLMDDPSLAREMSRNALKRYSELPQWNESMEQVRDYLISMEELPRIAMGDRGPKPSEGGPFCPIGRKRRPHPSILVHELEPFPRSS